MTIHSRAAAVGLVDSALFLGVSFQFVLTLSHQRHSPHQRRLWKLRNAALILAGLSALSLNDGVGFSGRRVWRTPSVTDI